MYIEGVSVLQMVDEATHFSAAQFVHAVTTESVWETVLMLCKTVYIGESGALVCDNGSQFRDFLQICEIHDVEWQKSETQRHSTLGV